MSNQANLGPEKEVGGNNSDDLVGHPVKVITPLFYKGTERYDLLRAISIGVDNFINVSPFS